MRSVEQSFDLISRRLESSADHLSRHSSRQDLAEGNYQAIKELSKLHDQIMAMQATLEGEERSIAKMFEVWNDQLLRFYLFLSIKGYSLHDFIRIIDQPIDLLTSPFEAMRKVNFQASHLNHNHYSLEESIAFMDENEKQYELIEKEFQNDIMTTKRQIEQLISKSLNR